MESRSFKEWLGGVIDSDGSIYISKEGYVTIEITQGVKDLRLLKYIQDKLKGGHVKSRSGVKAYRYRLSKRGEVLVVLEGIEEHLRLERKREKCREAISIIRSKLGLPVSEVRSKVRLEEGSHYMSGFFDGDGCLTWTKKKEGYPVMCVSISQKEREVLDELNGVYKEGGVYYSKSGKGHYVWSIQAESGVSKICEYLIGKSKSNRTSRAYMYKEFYRLRSLKAYKEESVYNKAWKVLEKKWRDVLEDV